jgi:hypothetical protein
LLAVLALPPLIVVAVLEFVLRAEALTPGARIAGAEFAGAEAAEAASRFERMPARPNAPGPVWTTPTPANVPHAPTPPPQPEPVPLPPAPPATASFDNSHNENAPVSAVLLWTASLAGLLLLGFIRPPRFRALSADRVLIAAPG